MALARMLVLAVLLLAGCGGEDEPETTGGGSGGEAAGYKMTLIAGVKGDEFYITMNCGAQEEAKKLGVDLDFQGPDQFDASLQTPIVNAVTANKPDAILIAPTDTKAMYNPIKQAADNGSKIVLVDTTLERADFAVSQIASDNEGGGRVAAETLAKLIGGSGKVFVNNVKPGISTTDLREQGFREEIATFPDIEYLGQEYCEDDPNIAAQVTSARLQSDPDLAGIFGTNLFSAQGAAQAIREQGRQGRVRVVGFDAGPTQVEQLRSEVVDILIAQHPGEIGEIAVQLLVDFLNTGTPPDPKELVTGATIVTRDTIDDPEVARYLYLADCDDYELSNATPTAAATGGSAAATPAS